MPCPDNKRAIFHEQMDFANANLNIYNLHVSVLREVDVLAAGYKACVGRERKMKILSGWSNLVFAQYGESILGLWTKRFSITSIIQLLGLFEREVERLYLLNKYKVLRTSLSLYNPSGIFDVYHQYFEGWNYSKFDFSWIDYKSSFWELRTQKTF